MTSEERFESIERDLAAAAALSLRNEQGIQSLPAALQANAAAQQANVAAPSEAVGAHVQNFKESLTALAERVAEYVAAGDAAKRRIEANLDALIRIITAEHSNGRGKLGE